MDSQSAQAQQTVQIPQQPTTQQAVNTTPQLQQSQPEQNKSNSGIILALMIIVIFALSGALIYMYYTNGIKSAKQTAQLPAPQPQTTTSPTLPPADLQNPFAQQVDNSNPFIDNQTTDSMTYQNPFDNTIQ